MTVSHLETESGAILETESGQELLVESQLFSLPQGPPDLRLTVLSPSANDVVILDASSDLQGKPWQVQYEKTTGGCGAGMLKLGLRYEEAFARGYATAMNLVEISTGDDMLQASCASGATKLYVASTEAYDVAQGEPVPQIYMYDGVTLTMRIPVTGVGQDANGNYITIGSPLAGGGNPTTLPAYTAGPTIIGRRRYAGYIARRERPKQNEPSTTLTLQPLAVIFDKTMGSYTFAQSANVDIGAAILSTLQVFGTPGVTASGAGFSTTLSASCAASASTIVVTSNTGIGAGTYIVLDYGTSVSERVLVASIAGSTCTLVKPTHYAHGSGATATSQSRWPQFFLNSANFPTLGISFTGTRTTSTVTSMLADFLGAISTGDLWTVVIDHDRQPRLLKLYTLSTNTYTYAVTMYQGIVDFEPLSISVQDQDTSNLTNALLITGATNVATNQPYNAIVVDPNSIAVYDGLQFDGAPVANSSLTTDAACASYGAGVLAGESLAQQQATFRVYGRLAAQPSFEPEGLPSGDVIRGIDGVTIVQFDQVGVSSNNCPDSEFVGTIANGGTNQNVWTVSGFSVVDLAGPAGSNALEMAASGSATATSPSLFVAPGRPFAPTVYVDATHVTGGTITVELLINGSIVASSQNATNGTGATVAIPPVVLPAGANTAQIQIVASGVTLSGGPLTVSQPMLADGGFARSYVPNYAAPSIYGLVSSVVTTISSDGDRYQDVTFSPIEPDWNAEVAEQINAAVAQVRQNAAPGTQIGQFTVSPDFALTYTGSSLVVTVATALAIFAVNTSSVVIGGNTFTLPASSVSWVWLNSNNTYTINQDPHTVTGSILLGFFQSGSSGVVGFTQKYSVGVVKLTSVSEMPSMGSQAAPVLTSVSGISYPVVGNGTYDAQVTFTVDVHSAPWLVGIALWTVAHGSSLNPLDSPKGVIDVAQSNGAGQYTAIWKSIGAGNIEDLYVSYIDGQGRLSPVTLVGTTVANPAGTSAFGPVGTTAPNVTSSLPPTFTYAAAGAATYDASCSITVDSNGTTSNNNLAELEVVIAPHASALPSSSASWTPVGAVVQKNGTGIYALAAGGLGAGTAYDIGLRYVGHTGDRSYVTVLGTTVTNPAGSSAFGPVGTTAPNVTSSLPPTFTYAAAGAATFDATFSLTVDANGTTANNNLAELEVVIAPHASGLSSTSTTWTPVGAVAQKNGSGNYTLAAGGLGAGTAYDIGLRYVGHTGDRSYVTVLGTTVTNPAGTIAFGPVGATAPVTSGLSAFTYAAVGASTFVAIFSLTTDANGTTSNNNLAEIEVVIAPHALGLTSTSATWTPAGSFTQKNGSGAYTFAAGGLGAGTAFDVGLRYVGHTGDRSNVAILATTAANPQVLANLPSMGAQGAPVLSNVNGPTYPVVGNSTFDATYTFTVDVTSATWLVGLSLFAVPSGTATDPRKSPIGFISVNEALVAQDLLTESSLNLETESGVRIASQVPGTYTATWPGLGASNSATYDLYVAYEDAQGVLSTATLVGTTTANPAGSTAFGAIGSTAPNPTSPASAPTYYATGASTFDAEYTISLDANGTTSNNNLAEVEIVTSPAARALTSSSTGWTPTGSVLQKNGTGAYVATAGGLGAGTAYQVGVRYVGHTGDRSYVYILGTTAANPQVLANLPSMGAQGAPSLSGVSGITYPAVGASTFDATASFTVDVHTATWLTGIELFAITTGSGSAVRSSPVGFISVNQSSAGAYTATWSALGASNTHTYDLYVAYVDAQGNFSPASLVGTTVANPQVVSNLPTMGAQAAPTLSGVSAITYPVVGASTFDAVASFTVDVHTAAWLTGIELFAITTGSGSAVRSSPVGFISVGQSSAGTYTATWSALGSSNTHTFDLYVAYVDAQGNFSPASLVGTTTANPQVLSNLPSMGAQGAPTVTGFGGFTYPVVGNSTFDAVGTFTVDVHSAPWLDGLILCAVAHSSSTDPRKSIIGFIDVAQSNGAGQYTATWPGLGASNSQLYDLYVAYEDGQGVYSVATLVGTTSANPAGTTAFADIGSTAPNPSSAASAFSYAVNGGGTYDAQCTIHLDSNGTTANNNLAEIEVVMAPHASGLGSTSDGWTPSGAAIAVNGTGTYVAAAGGCGVQVAYDIGVRYVGHTGKRTNVYIIGTTTAAQLAQLPFAGVSIDPTTGYIVVADQAVYETTQAYALGSGVSSLLSASWNAKIGSTSIDHTIYLLWNGSNGYKAYWSHSDNKVHIEKVTSGSSGSLGISTITQAIDATNFHNLEFIATQTTAGTVNLTATLDGVLMVQATDTSSIYTSGAVAVQFFGATATNYVDEKTIEIEFGGDPSSSGIKGQGNISPGMIPYTSLIVSSNSSPYGGFTHPTRELFVGPVGGTQALTLADGSVIQFPPVTALNDTAGNDGTWYYSIAYIISTLTVIYYLSQTAPTAAQLQAFWADGVVPITVGQSLVVTTGSATTVAIGYGTSGGSSTGGFSKRYIQ